MSLSLWGRAPNEDSGKIVLTKRTVWPVRPCLPATRNLQPADLQGGLDRKPENLEGGRAEQASLSPQGETAQTILATPVCISFHGVDVHDHGTPGQREGEPPKFDLRHLFFTPHAKSLSGWIAGGLRNLSDLSGPEMKSYCVNF